MELGQDLGCEVAPHLGNTQGFGVSGLRVSGFRFRISGLRFQGLGFTV